MLPQWNRDPDFLVTRASHAVLSVRDLDASVAFYRDVAGLVVTDQSTDIAWLRGLEEVAHHSLVLRATTGDAVCEQVGFRVREPADIARAQAPIRKKAGVRTPQPAARRPSALADGCS